jgi:hypothetical protein
MIINHHADDCHTGRFGVTGVGVRRFSSEATGIPRWNALAVAVPAAYRDWRSFASLAVDAVSSAHSNRAYEKALKDFVAGTRPKPGPLMHGPQPALFFDMLQGSL